MIKKLFPYGGFLTRERTRSLIVGIVLLLLALIFQAYALKYSTRTAGNFVGDFLLDNLPVLNLNPIIVEGALAAIAATILLLLARPRYLLFSIKAVALFVAARSLFVAMTHLGIYPGQVSPGAGPMDSLYAALDLQAGYFFSAHTGLPFLMALIFWRERFWRCAFLLLSAVFGISVLLAHVHYSIDVFAAPFMTYSIFRIAQYLFPQDHKLIAAE